jgi:RND family efflux transporter MFP subunit
MKYWSLLPSLAVAAACAGCHGGSGGAVTAVKRTVPVAVVKRRDLADSITLQGEFRPYQEVDLHAEVTGFLREIPVDFGDQVKAGQVLARLEVPELEADLARAQATRRRAVADDAEAGLEFKRIDEVRKSNPHLLAEQELDSATAKQSVAAANLAAAQADVTKYQTLVTYSRITAPFSGVITQRNGDPGALIQAGAGSASASPLLRLSENDRLRLDFPISASQAERVRVGIPIEVAVEGWSKPLPSTVSRMSRRISAETRTMQVEADIPNPDLRLIPGMYATVRLDLTRAAGALSVPVGAVKSGAKPAVFLVQSDGTIVERPVKLGLQTPEYDEVLGGLAEGDQVIVGQLSAFRAGEVVQPKASDFSAE